MSVLSLLGSVLPGVIDVVDELVEDKDKANELKKKIEGQLIDLDKQTHLTNQAEAQHKSIFVAGWRPMVGWTCSISFGIGALLVPLYNYVVLISGAELAQLPMYPLELTAGLLLAMLGYGGARTVEKLRGITSS